MAQYVSIFPSEARTATHASRDLKNSVENGGLNNVGLVLVVNSTAKVASPSVVFSIQGKDPASNTYYTILDSAAVVTSGTQIVMRVHPDLTASTNVTAKDMLPAVWRVVATHADADSITYSVGASMI
jgi:hypothetical protein